MVLAKLNNQFEIILPKHRADRPEWYTKEGWEKKRLDSMYGNLFGPSEKYPDFPQDIIFYIGAEEGEMAALCQMWGAKVVLFEPNPKAWSHIRAIWEANNLEKPLGIVTCFASDVTKRFVANEIAEVLQEGEDGWPICSKNEMEAAHGFKELDKEADTFGEITIDDVVLMGGSVPTAISLDVEGSEGKVLRGAEETLRKHHPKIWLSGHPEFLHDNFNGGGGFEYLRELRDWLKKDLGYTEQILDYDHEVHLFYEVG